MAWLEAAGISGRSATRKAPARNYTSRKVAHEPTTPPPNST